MVLRHAAPVVGERADRRDLRERRDKRWFCQLPGCGENGNSLRAGDRRSENQKRSGPPDVAGQPPQQAVRVLRRDRQVPGPRDGRGRRLRQRGGGLEFTGVPHDGRQMDVHRQQQAAHRGRLFQQHRRLHERVSAGDRAAARLGGLVRERVAPGSRSDRHHEGAAGFIHQHPEPAAVQRSGVGFLRHRLPQHESGLPADVGALRPHQGCQRRPHAAVQQHRHRHPLHRAQQRAGLQHAVRAGGGSELRPGHLRSGPVDVQASDDQCRPAVGSRQRQGARADVAGWTLRGRAAVRRDAERAELERHRAAFRACLRSVRDGEDRPQVFAEPVQRFENDRRRELRSAALQPARRGLVHAAVDRCQQRRHRTGRARLRVSDARVRDQLRRPAVGLWPESAHDVRPEHEAHLEP